VCSGFVCVVGRGGGGGMVGVGLIEQVGECIGYCVSAKQDTMSNSLKSLLH
jgi:hypothetical protein